MRYRSLKYLARVVPLAFRQGFPRSHVSGSARRLGISDTRLSSLRPDFDPFSILRLPQRSPNPAMHASRFGALSASLAATLKSINFSFFLFRVLRCFSSRVPHTAMYSLHADRGFLCGFPFRYLRIIGYVLLPKLFAAYHVFHRLS